MICSYEPGPIEWDEPQRQPRKRSKSSEVKRRRYSRARTPKAVPATAWQQATAGAKALGDTT